MKSSELVRLYLHAGWIQIRQSGSHKIFKNPDTGEIVSVPFHGSKEVGIRLTYALLRRLKKK